MTSTNTTDTRTDAATQALATLADMLNADDLRTVVRLTDDRVGTWVFDIYTNPDVVVGFQATDNDGHTRTLAIVYVTGQDFEFDAAFEDLLLHY